MEDSRKVEVGLGWDRNWKKDAIIDMMERVFLLLPLVSSKSMRIGRIREEEKQNKSDIVGHAEGN